MYKKRINKIKSRFSDFGIDSILITSLENIRYFSGFTSTDGSLLITGSGCYIFTDFRYQFDAKEKAPDYTLCLTVNSGASMFDQIKQKLQDDGCKACGFEEGNITVSVYKHFMNIAGIEFVPCSSNLSSFRLIKDSYEVECLQKAQDMADRSYSEFIGSICSGMTEKELSALLEYICAKNGSEGPSFDTIIGSGPNGANCHAVPSDRKIGKGDLVVVDFGCVYHGYHSDMTRTFAVIDIDDQLKKIYDIVLEAQLRALHALKPGITGKQLDAVARDYISSCGYGDAFGHSLGHGFGLLIHENPRASVVSEEVFKPGMTITVEPGIYLENIGGVRIEDCCILTEDGYHDFVSVSKELVYIQ